MLNTLAPTETLTKDDWLKLRRQGIGGSDVGAVCGLNKYKSAFELWVEKLNLDEKDETDENEFTYWGNALEPVIRSEFMHRTGFTVSTVPAILQHSDLDYSFMLATIDGIVHTPEGEYIFEAKTASAYLLDDWTNGVPYSYQLQVQHYMAVTDLQGAYVACLVGGNHFIHHFIERDNELIDMIIRLEKEFWDCVESNTPPEIDGSNAAKEYINSLFPVSTNPESITLDDSCMKIIDNFEIYEAQEKIYKDLKEKCANELKLLIGENESATVADRVISWRNVTSERFDSKRLAYEMPEIYSQYLNQSSYRRFTIKSKKGE